MGKYYVQSGDLLVTIAGPHIKNAKEAAKEALLNHATNVTKLCSFTIVSEQGFDYGHETADVYFDTCELIEEAGFEFEDEENEYE